MLNPISEEAKGISFIEEYIKRIGIENQFINSVGVKIVSEFLKNTVSCYKEEYFNLCEPVLVSSIGRTLLRYELNSLELSEYDIELLGKRFNKMSRKKIFAHIMNAISQICKVVYNDEEVAIYFESEAESLSVRVEIAVKSGCLSNIFMPVSK